MLPRLNDTSNILNPTEGLFMFNRHTQSPSFYNGSRWQTLAPSFTASTDSVTYTLAGIGTPGPLAAVNMSFAAALPIAAESGTIAFSKKLDVNTVPIQLAFLNTSIISSIEFTYYRQGSSTPYVSVKLKNLKLLAQSYALANGDGGGLTDENYSATFEIYGFKDWVNNMSFGYNMATHTQTTY
jgi:hypothetical protein